jgi:hypothetical protein
LKFNIEEKMQFQSKNSYFFGVILTVISCFSVQINSYADVVPPIEKIPNNSKSPENLNAEPLPSKESIDKKNDKSLNQTEQSKNKDKKSLLEKEKTSDARPVAAKNRAKSS